VDAVDVAGGSSGGPLDHPAVLVEEGEDPSKSSFGGSGAGTKARTASPAVGVVTKVPPGFGASTGRRSFAEAELTKS
jgi:hypothetical protein